MSVEEAKKHYAEYLETVKTRKEKYLEDLKQVYYHLSKGHKVLDIYEVFKKSGVNKDGEPNLAICRADLKKVVFAKRPIGSGRFSDGSWKSHEADISLPSETFSEWKTTKATESWRKDQDIVSRPDIEADVPIVPAHLLPEGKLDNYYILWEVMEWRLPKSSAVFRKGDPFLLKRVNDNAFIVLAEWDLTEVEQAVIRGL